METVLEGAAADESRLEGVEALGVDEHARHHGDERRHGPKMMTGMVDLTKNDAGDVQAGLLDLVPGRSGPVYAEWLDARGEEFRASVKVAALDPSRRRRSGRRYQPVTTLKNE